MKLSPKQALELWRAVAVGALGRAQPELTARQFALLLQVYLMPRPHTVRGLARELDMSKPAVSRALDTLGRLGLVRRKQDQKDRRSVLVQRTVKGAVFLREFADLAGQVPGGCDRGKYGDSILFRKYGDSILIFQDVLRKNNSMCNIEKSVLSPYYCPGITVPGLA